MATHFTLFNLQNHGLEVLHFHFFDNWHWETTSYVLQYIFTSEEDWHTGCTFTAVLVVTRL